MRARAERIEALDWLDRAALAGSVACMIHCLGLPLLIAALPAFAATLSMPEALHRWMLAFAIPAGALALGMGRMRHGAEWPLLVGGMGLALLATGALVVPDGVWETAATVAGGVLVGGAHVANWRLRRPCAVANAA